MMDPRELSHQLRTSTDPDIRRRRWIIGLSLAGAAAGAIVTLYQTGILRHLPDPPLDVFDSDRVDASTYAYKRMESPDGALMTISYAITAWLAAAGGEGRRTAFPYAMGAKIAADILVALQLAREEWAENKALCVYCQGATVASLASLALALPEIRAASHRLPSAS